RLFTRSYGQPLRLLSSHDEHGGRTRFIKLAHYRCVLRRACDIRVIDGENNVARSQAGISSGAFSLSDLHAALDRVLFAYSRRHINHSPPQSIGWPGLRRAARLPFFLFGARHFTHFDVQRDGLALTPDFERSARARFGFAHETRKIRHVIDVSTIETRDHVT